MFNDAGYHELGFSVDDIKLGGTVLSDFENGAGDWTLDGFRLMDGSSYTSTYTQYYLAENRQYQGYDKTLAEGPYSYDYSVTAPNKVDQFPYQDGLLVWYSNGLCGDNNTSAHPGCGEALPVDANAEYRLWTKDGKPAAYASGRLNSYDSTFDVDETDALHLAQQSGTATLKYDVDAHPSIPVFDDSDVNGYWDDTWQRSGWYSTKVAGAGTMIQVVSSDEETGQMVIKAGQRFIATTSGKAAITGDPKVGETLKAVAPTYYQKDAITSFQWRVDGRPVLNATDDTFTVTPAQAGKEISVVVSGTKAGYLSAKEIVSVTVAPAATTLGVTAPARAKTGTRPVLTATVTSADAQPTGRVLVRWAGTTVTKSLANGTATFRLAKVAKPGTKKAVVRYLADTGFAGARKVVSIRITK
jgi:immune inhibitor A